MCTALFSPLSCLENKLEEIKKTYSINQRWLPSDREYTENEQAMILVNAAFTGIMEMFTKETLSSLS